MTEDSDNHSEPLPKRGYGIDAYEPDQIAEQVLRIGVKKTRYPVYKTMTLGLMGGGFISLGALYELYVMAHPFIDAGTAALVAPLFYAMGYIIAFIAGAEIFTTNNLSAMHGPQARSTYGISPKTGPLFCCLI
jgi:formate transporter